MTETCGAPHCTNPTAHATGGNRRRINGMELCRACYQRAWDLEKSTGKSKEDIMREGLPPVFRPLPRIATTCATAGCGIRLPKNGDVTVRRAIGQYHVCRNCYQRAWEYGQNNNVSIKEAFNRLQLIPKGYKPPPAPKPRVSCALPWCSAKLVTSIHSRVTDVLHACGECRRYMNRIAKRTHNERGWKAVVMDALKGNVQSPDTPLPCSMPWCDRRERIRAFGPNGEPICHTDRAYLWGYAQRHDLTFAEAFRKAPPPRFLHVRKK